MEKKLTLAQIQEAAKKNNIPVEALRAVIEVECKGSGFNSDNTPVILFERHVFKTRLATNGKSDLALKLSKEHPDICNSNMGAYGKYSEQHKRLAKAANFDRVSALESCSWGIGQVMGYHWKSLGYSTIQQFINCMYQDELSQLEAMLKFIKINSLDKFLRELNWKEFAYRYNGKSYRINKYDDKLMSAYNKYKKK